MLANRPWSGGWEGPAVMLGLMVSQMAATVEEGQPGQGQAGAARPPLLRPADCVRIVEAFLPRGPGLAGPAVRAHHAAYGHVVCALLQLAGAALRGSLPGAPGPGIPGGSGGARQAEGGAGEACSARAAEALCRALAAAFRWLLSGQRGPEVPEEGEEVRRRVGRATEAASIQLWGSVKEHGAYLDPPTWLHAGMQPLLVPTPLPPLKPREQPQQERLPTHQTTQAAPGPRTLPSAVPGSSSGAWSVRTPSAPAFPWTPLRLCTSPWMSSPTAPFTAPRRCAWQRCPCRARCGAARPG
jgi:hypothetical protein